MNLKSLFCIISVQLSKKITDTVKYFFFGIAAQIDYLGQFHFLTFRQAIPEIKQAFKGLPATI
jgi:hypothetical protein